MTEQKRIEIIPNGPYRVFGEVPLRMMAPVVTYNTEPIAWHDLGLIATNSEPYDLCRCGQSATKPFCDSTHEWEPFDGTEIADRRPYRDRAKSWRRRDQLSLADDEPICTNAGFCGTRTTNVWEMFRRNDPKETELMREMIWRCPSGRLVLFSADGFPNEPDLPQEIAVLPGGPLWVRGGIPIIGAYGALWEPRNRVTLCRCGQSGNKPFCDKTHESIHFDER